MNRPHFLLTIFDVLASILYGIEPLSMLLGYLLFYLIIQPVSFACHVEA